jgi:hypothetical protein
VSEGWAGWLAERHVEETPAQQMSRQGWQGLARQDRAEAAADAERAAEAGEARDARLMAFRAAGVVAHSPGDVFTRGAALGDEDAAYQDAKATMEKIERRRERRDAVARDEMAALSRSAPPGDSLEEASRRAHRAFREHTRAMMAEATVAPRSEPRPFSPSAGAAADAECSGAGCPVCAEGRRRDAARSRETAPYAPGSVITTGYREISR